MVIYLFIGSFYEIMLHGFCHCSWTYDPWTVDNFRRA